MHKYLRMFLPIGIFVLLFAFSVESFSQIIVNAPNVNKASSQLIYYYDQTDFSENQGGVEPNTVMQVTNTNDTQGITIHVQVFRNFDPDDDGPQPAVICDERDFIDFLTPNDTHIYDLGSPNFPKNKGETEITAGDTTTIDLTDENDTDGTKGFVVITPVVSESDLTAVAFQHLIGSSKDIPFSVRLNARGRDAVDFLTGKELADFTPLDGINTGFEIIQAEESTFSFSNDFGPSFVDLVFIAIQDSYGEPGLLGYTVQPATGSFSTFIYDFKEDVTSCGNREFTCFLTLGVNDTFPQNNTEISNGNDVLCAGVETPLNPGFVAKEISPQVFTLVETPSDVEGQLTLKFFSNVSNEKSQVSQELAISTSFFSFAVAPSGICAICFEQNGLKENISFQGYGGELHNAIIENFCPEFCYFKRIKIE